MAFPPGKRIHISWFEPFRYSENRTEKPFLHSVRLDNLTWLCVLWEREEAYRYVRKFLIEWKGPTYQFFNMPKLRDYNAKKIKVPVAPLLLDQIAEAEQVNKGRLIKLILQKNFKSAPLPRKTPGNSW